MGVFLQGCWHILWVVHLMGDQRASWPDDVVFAIIYLPAAGKCRLNSNNYGKCHLERMMGLCSDGSPGWWVISTEVEEGLGGPFEQPRWCEALRVYLSTSLYVTPLPLPRQIIANPTIGISSQLRQSHTHNHQKQDRPKIWWTAAIEKHPFAGNMNHNRTSKSLKKREWRCDTWGLGAKKGIRGNQTMKGDLFSAGADRPVFKIAMEMKKLRTPELNNVYDFSVVCVRVFLASYLKYSD